MNNDTNTTDDAGHECCRGTKGGTEATTTTTGVTTTARTTTNSGPSAIDRLDVEGWSAFNALPNFSQATDPTYAILREAGYQPVSIATFRVRDLRTRAEDYETTGRTDEELVSLCERCCTTPDGDPVESRHGRFGLGGDTQVWVSYFQNQSGDGYVHVDRSGYDQSVVTRYFGKGCCTN